MKVIDKIKGYYIAAVDWLDDHPHWAFWIIAADFVWAVVATIK